MVQELQPEHNRVAALFKQFLSESKAIIIAAVALIVAVLALLMAFMAVYDAIHAKAQLDVVLESNADLKMEVRLLQMKSDRLEAKLDAKGDKE